MKRVLLLVLAMLLTSCSSTTLITSTDKDAKIYLDGMYVGKGQYTQTDTKIVGATTMVQLKKEGCEDQMYVYSRSEEFDVGACIGGAILIVPFLWIMKYKPLHNYEFECIAKK